MLRRPSYLGVTNALALLRLLPTSDRHKDAGILALRQQVAVLERQLHGEQARFTPAGRVRLPRRSRSGAARLAAAADLGGCESRCRPAARS
ncbi:hypothetical protein [Paractinoplanes brasiliensis]|uniref:Uncharacterized protein n=1 Tax=Paractinoplanes brasiliensis TaxID=52695 RepID=A0A4R6JAS4_9ACTN|nr:hypothetical protein [Actinoplanes brasiliensis]TDO31546.1 hypothetical protein C8E87_6972 [Actinoplanes brasiliensis]GID30945.1 hypothetical protein Abr02nite_59280 [Actinoplanes brasiliensis]